MTRFQIFNVGTDESGFTINEVYIDGKKHPTDGRYSTCVDFVVYNGKDGDTVQEDELPVETFREFLKFGGLWGPVMELGIHEELTITGSRGDAIITRFGNQYNVNYVKVSDYPSVAVKTALALVGGVLSIKKRVVN